MANYSTLKAAVADVVKTNGTQAITGANLQAVLMSIINSVGGGGYIFKGVATPSTDAGTPDQNVFYIGGAGTYANFGTSVTVPVGSICVFKYNGSWAKETITMFAGIDDVPTVGSDNLVKSDGVAAAFADIDYRIAFVNVYKKTVTQGSSENGYIDVSPIKGDVYIRVRISGDYEGASQTIPALYIHYKGDGESTWTYLGIVKPNVVVKVSAGEREIDRIHTYGNYNWDGIYYIDIYNDIEARLVDNFIPKPIDIQLTHIGYRDISQIGQAGKGEFFAKTTTAHKISPILNVGAGKVVAYHHVTTNIPWLFVYKTDGTYDYYITSTPNTNVAAGTNNHMFSEIVLPNDVLAIQLCINTTIPSWYCQFIPANAESLSIYTQNRVLDYSDKLTIAKYMFNEGNEVDGGANFRTSDYIEVFENDYIEMGLAVSGIAGNPFACTIATAFFDEKYSIIGSIIRDTAGSERMFYYGAIPSGTKYIKFGCNIAELPVPYALIHRGIEDNTETTAQDDVKILPSTYNIVGKNIALFGDSITQGEAATSAMDDSYAGILRKMFACEHGGNINYGFEHFAISTEHGYMVNLVSATSWTRDYSNTNVLGGDRYSTSTANALLKFKIAKSCHYIKVSSQYDTSFGVINVEQGNTVLATIDLSAETKIGTSSLIDVSACDFTQDFVLRCVSGTVNASGIVVIDNTDWWTYNNYGRSGAPASLFVGDLFDAQADGASVILYALGANSDWKNLYNTIESIKEQFKSINAVKIVLDVCNYSSAKISNTMPKKALLRQLARYVGATYICVGDHYPKQSNGDAIQGFFASDNAHPTDAGHQFIAELIAKNIGLSVNAKELAAKLYDD